MSSVTVGSTIEENWFRKEVGTGSKSQCWLIDWLPA